MPLHNPITEPQIPQPIARDTEFQAADVAHAASTNPHPNANYLTQAEADARYLNTGGGGSGIAATIARSEIESALRSGFRSNFFIESHYLSTTGSGDFVSSSGNGGFGYAKAEIDHPGIMGLSTGSNPAGFASSSSSSGNNSSGIILDDGNIKYITIVKIPILRDAVNDFILEIGFQSAGTSIGLDACCFVFDNSSANWQCHTRTNGDLAVFTSNVPVIANQWLEMQISVTNGVAAFTINGIDVLTTSQKLPLNPRMVGAGIDIRKVSGTAGRDIWIDYQSVDQKFNDVDENITVHSRPLTDADIPDTIARSEPIEAEITAAITAHVTATDPHPAYLNQTEVTAAIAAHENIVDLHHTRCKIFNFLTAATDGGVSFVSHGLASNKILGSSILVEGDTGIFLSPNTTSYGYMYDAFIAQGYIYINNFPGDSYNLISKSVRAMIWYLP
ncbi:hypothetical protein QUB40_26325 [Microcoleus sp. AT9_A2]|uniref:hypothetical protein n=1 Tax=Microcoleus sp. AT9_A2 TaxID=2818624 RepID=UPI002FD1416A